MTSVSSVLRSLASLSAVVVSSGVVLTSSVASADTFAETSQALKKYISCSDEWTGGIEYRGVEIQFNCSNGRGYYIRGADCIYRKHGLLFDSTVHDNVQLVCDVHRAKAAQCLFDNINVRDTSICGEEYEVEHAKLIRYSHGQ